MFSWLSNASALETTKAATRAGFVELVLEKSRRATPHVARARALRAAITSLADARALLSSPISQNVLLAAAGVSDKAAAHLDQGDKREALAALISQVLEPEGDSWRDELVYRFLLTRGDTLGGEMRNVVGALGQRKLSRALVAALQLTATSFSWRDGGVKTWLPGQSATAGIENDLNGLTWNGAQGARTLLFNLTPPRFSKNIDLCLVALDASASTTHKELRIALSEPELYVAFGELKSGFDPAGADEHWKTAQSALVRIRENYREFNPATFFIGAAIVPGMAQEIWTQLQSGTLSCAANLNDELQLAGLCAWLTSQ